MVKVASDVQWQDLVNHIKALEYSFLGNVMSNNDNLNNYDVPGIYVCDSAVKAATLSNTPITTAGFKMYVEYTISTSRLRQTIHVNNASSDTFIRSYTATGWSGWRKITTTAV